MLYWTTAQYWKCLESLRTNFFHQSRDTNKFIFLFLLIADCEGGAIEESRMMFALPSVLSAGRSLSPSMSSITTATLSSSSSSSSETESSTTSLSSSPQFEQQQQQSSSHCHHLDYSMLQQSSSSDTGERPKKGEPKQISNFFLFRLWTCGDGHDLTVHGTDDRSSVVSNLKPRFAE